MIKSELSKQLNDAQFDKIKVELVEENYNLKTENENLCADLYEAREAMDDIRDELTICQEENKRLKDAVSTLYWIIEERKQNNE